MQLSFIFSRDKRSHAAHWPHQLESLLYVLEIHAWKLVLKGRQAQVYTSILYFPAFNEI